MEINIKATPEEIAKLLQAVGSSKEQSIIIDPEEMAKDLRQVLEGSLFQTRP